MTRQPRALARVRVLAVGSMLPVLAACSSLNTTGVPADCYVPQDERISRLDLQHLAELLATDLCPVQAARQHPGDPMAVAPAGQDAPGHVVVPDLVDVQTLQADALGLSFGDLFRASISSVCKLSVVHPELAARLKLSPAGLNALTREASGAHTQKYAAATAIVGTYSVQDTRFTVIAREVDMASSAVLRVSAHSVAMGCRKTIWGKPEFVYRIDSN